VSFIVACGVEPLQLIPDANTAVAVSWTLHGEEFEMKFEKTPLGPSGHPPVVAAPIVASLSAGDAGAVTDVLVLYTWVYAIPIPFKDPDGSV
jgi:hypothetical protein